MLNLKSCDNNDLARSTPFSQGKAQDVVGGGGALGVLRARSYTLTASR